MLADLGAEALDADRLAHEVLERPEVTRAVCAQLGAGLTLGLGLAWATTGAMQTLLFGVGPHDSLVFSASGLLLVGVGLVASALPAWRAAMVAPVHALSSKDRPS